MRVNKYIILYILVVANCFAGLSFSALAQENSMSDEYVLLEAVRDRAYGKIRSQLQKGANVNTRVFSSGETPLYIAASLKDTVSTTFLLEKSANTDIPNKETGETPLMVAVRLGAKEVVELLLSQRADVNKSDRRGETALFKAVQIKNRTMVKLLLTSDADWSIADYTGRTPLDVAHENRAPRSLIRLLQEAGAEY